MKPHYTKVQLERAKQIAARRKRRGYFTSKGFRKFSEPAWIAIDEHNALAEVRKLEAKLKEQSG